MVPKASGSRSSGTFANQMSRFIAILFCCALFGLVVLSAATEQLRPVLDFDTSTIWIHTAAGVALIWGLIAYCGFAALHSTQHISCPLERSTWLLVTIGANALGSCIYYCTVYQTFRRDGFGSLLSRKKQKKEIEQSGPDNPRPCGTSGMSDAGASAPPEASGGI